MTRAMSYALNIADATRYSEIVRNCLIVPVIKFNTVVEVDRKSLDGSAVVLDCEESRALAIIQMLRDADNRAKQYAIRAYKSGPRGGWKQVTP